ncbi:hypothetical protein Fmac_004834 [Flemingia macrophylla]|uniref:Protein kinase domain-containing protein n=1 Tax=Flemingia macrophylla TaxID=520843 RepID=A0ABD1N616_9FABA
MANLKTNCMTSFLLLVSLQHVTSKPSQPPTPPKTPNKTNTGIPIIASAVAATLLVLSLIGFLLFRCVRRKVGTASDGNPEPSSTRCREFSLAEIRAATRNFHEGLIVGRGGFGDVYKGTLDTCGNKAVAIKRLIPGSEQGLQEFETEIKMLSRFRHANLVSLIGFCNGGGEMILVYDFMSRGTLRDHLYGGGGGGTRLSWERRLKICVEAARGLEFLHSGGGDRGSVIHRDVKSTNILLDEDWVAKVSDFGLSKVGPNASSTHVTTDVKGSFGYLDPEYYMSLWLTQKSDVYSFGVVLLEVLCGRGPVESRVENKQQGFLVAWVRRCHHDGNVHQTVDPALNGAIAPKCLKKFLGIALSCLNDRGKERPLMRDVVKGLEHALDLQHCYSRSQGPPGGVLKGKAQTQNVEIHERFPEVVINTSSSSSSSSSSSKATCTTSRSEEEQALVHGVFQTAR